MKTVPLWFSAIWGEFLVLVLKASSREQGEERMKERRKRPHLLHYRKKDFNTRNTGTGLALADKHRYNTGAALRESVSQY